MANADEETPQERLMQAFEMFEVGVSMMRARLRREHPDADPEEIQRLVQAWLMTRPGAEHGDTVGVPRSLDDQ